MSRVIICVVLVASLASWSCQEDPIGPQIYPRAGNEDYDFWMQKEKEELEVAMNRVYKLRGDKDTSKLRRPKNVLLFIGDGMSLTTITAARIYRGQQKKQRSGEELLLSWEEFPETALLKTYNVDRQTPDSAATATALFTGIKTNFYTMGYDSNIRVGSAESIKTAKKLDTIIDWGQSAGKRTGIVTNTRLTHATPAALYAHSPHRYWECDAGLKRDNGYGTDNMIAPGEDNPNYNDTLDIARQLVYDETAKKANVILGGGLRSFKAIDGVKKSKWTCVREDGRDLVEEWKTNKRKEGAKHAYVTNTEELRNINPTDVDHLLGIFSNSHLSYEDVRDKSDKGQPSLSELTTSALSILTVNDKNNGFVLVVEGGRIDHAHHENWATRAMEETVALHQTVQDSVSELERKGLLEDTLIIVTSDHSHVMSMMGYGKRGTDIRGVTGDLTDENMQEPILSYANGRGVKNMYSSEPDPVSGKCKRNELKQEDFLSMEHRAPAMIYDYDEHHGGDDVALWARGPMSYLFHKTHEQSYVAHVIGYSLCMGPYAEKPECRHHRTSNAIRTKSSASKLTYTMFFVISIPYLVQIF